MAQRRYHITQPNIPGLTILEEIGRGIHNSVYRVERDSQTYALKMPLPGSTSTAETLLQFRREGAALALVQHPSLPEVIELGQSDHTPYILMEYVQGQTLRERLDAHDLDQATVIQLAKVLASALAAIHREGIVHRDLQPRNILIDQTGQFRLIDFGFVGYTSHATAPSDVLGTLHYSSPEQTGMVKRPVDGRSDLYALGAILFECIAGVPPFTAASASELVRLHAVAPPPQLRLLNPAVSPTLHAIILRTLAKDPDDRYQTAEGLFSDLEHIEQFDRLSREGHAVELALDDYRTAALYESAMVGREAHLAELREYWNDARRGHGNVVVIEGVSGVGKSHLAREMLHRAASAQGLVFETRCDKTTTTPFSVVRDVLKQYLHYLKSMPVDQRHAAEDALRGLIKPLGQRVLRLLPDVTHMLGVQSLLNAQPTDHEDVADGFAALLRYVLRVYPGSVWLIDDVQYLDESSVLVLRLLIKQLQHEPVLIMMVFGQDHHSLHIQERLLPGTIHHVHKIQLDLLNEQETGNLISAWFGGYTVEERLIQEIALRSGGNPFAVREYMQTILDAGLLRLHQSTWYLEPEDYATLQLPPQIVPLLLQRVDQLNSSTRAILQAAALSGYEFTRTDLQLMCDGAINEVNTALIAATQAHLVERSTLDRYRFVHEHIRDALLARLSEAGQRNLHLHIAKVLDTATNPSIDTLYRVAHHYAGAHSVRHQRRMLETNIAAGRLAVSNAAYDEAYTFFAHAYELAPFIVQTLAEDVVAEFAEACYRTGRIAEALELLEQAILRSNGALERARMRVQRLEIRAWYESIELNDPDILLALEEFDVLWPQKRAKQMFDGLRLLLLHRWPFKSSAGVPGSVAAPLARLYTMISEIAYLRGDVYTMMYMALRILALRVTDAPLAERIEAQCLAAVFQAQQGLHYFAHQFMARIVKQTQNLKDPMVQFRVDVYHARVLSMLGNPQTAEPIFERILDTPVHWSDMLLYTQSCMEFTWNLWLRGRIYDAWQSNHRVTERVAHYGMDHVPPTLLFLPLTAALLLIMLGNPAEAEMYLRKAREYANTHGAQNVYSVACTMLELAMLMEQGEIGAAMNSVLQNNSQKDFVQIACNVAHMRYWFVLQAYARLHQATYASRRHKLLLLRQLKQALRQLKQVASTPLLKAHWYVIAGAYQRIKGHFEAALKLFGQAEALAYQSDCPWVLLEVAFQRALILQAQHQTAMAHYEAQTALHIALEHGWNTRAQHIRKTFELHEQPFESKTSLVSDSEMLRLQRQLEALLRVILSWTSVRNPLQQAQVALDVIVQILGAERAFLFTSDTDTLVFQAGRDAAGNDVHASDDWSRTLLERVRVTRQPVIVHNNTDEFVADMESVVQSHVRSVLAAPLIFEDRLLGALYLDNRLIWGVFSDADVEVLLAIANHVALGLETSRTAQLEISVEAERRQRQLAEQLRQLAGTLNSSLELEVVLDQSLAALQQLIPYDRAAIMLVDAAQQATYVALRGYAAPELLRQQSRLVSADPLLQEMASRRQAVLITHTPADTRFEALAQQKVTSILGMPLEVRDSLIGFVMLEQHTGAPFSERDAEIGMVFAAQAAVAIDNARLFGEIQRLAITDGLTHVWNRRYFFELSEREWSRALRYDHPLSVLMIDADHFKRVNDTYGHAAGDYTLTTLVEICRQQLRESDILGRYGGEEFAVVLPDTDLSAAYATAERLRSAVEQAELFFNHQHISLTVSIGVASKTSTMISLAALLDRADRGLYLAKEMGRNRVVMA